MAKTNEIQKLKDTLDEKGCFYGKFNRGYIEQTKEDINGIGKKVDWLIKLLIANFGLVIVIAIILKIWGSK